MFATFEDSSFLPTGLGKLTIFCLETIEITVRRIGQVPLARHHRDKVKAICLLPNCRSWSENFSLVRTLLSLPLSLSVSKFHTCGSSKLKKY